ncbi:MAG: tRNA lysidine(34) synthetase TilS [Actinomycetota bacterium]|nr:tRNA lysidine(34) synthetase TilS [Actinomycetota bacterium]
MTKGGALETLKEAAEASGLVDSTSDGVVLVSGGADSACTAAALAAIVGPERLHALHVNYGLREAAAADEQTARRLCAALRIDLHVERVTREDLGPGNLQAAARAARYLAAERLRTRYGVSWIATGHTRSDVAETVVYRLAKSPGSRALLGLSPRAGRVIRPLLSLSREETRSLATAAGLPFADDESNLDPVFARNRIRADVLPALAKLSPQTERNIAETRAELSEEAALLERVAFEALERAGTGPADTHLDARALRTWEPALQRLALRSLAERAAGRQVALGRARATDIARLAGHPEGGEIQLGGGISAVSESGTVFFRAGDPLDAAPEPVPSVLTLPGRAQVGDWEVRAELHPAPVAAAGPELATLDAAALGAPLHVRTWQQGDRMRPLGMGGTKTLGDLFADHGVPRSQRTRVPVVTCGDHVAWVAGVAVSDDFRLGADTTAAAVLTARPL